LNIFPTKYETPDSIYEFVLEGVKNPEENRYLADIILEKLQINGDLKLKNCSGGQIRRKNTCRPTRHSIAR